MAVDHRYRPAQAVVGRVISWYDEHGRDLPWRRPEADPWQIMVSEYMLQQTPVARVLEPWRRWVERWPTPTALSAASSGEAVRAWGRLGYPRRAVRLHQAATAITVRHHGDVPAGHEQLLALPGVGGYTAAAIASFAFRQRHVVLDTNVRRVLARIDGGIERPAPSLTSAERLRAEHYLPRSGARAARWAVASMELGALVCTARTPRCASCPVSSRCRWRRLGHPVADRPTGRSQSYVGTDRQCRGALLAVLRSAEVAVPAEELAAAWPDGPQRSRCLQSLEVDGLLQRQGQHGYLLPER